MTKTLQTIFIVVFVSACIIACAKRGSPTGGPVDVEPPTFVKAAPENFTTNFDQEEIRIYFEEYIKLDQPQRQIIVSPPMNPKALITPLGTPRKYVTIEILDTLQENTTYTVSFGQSIIGNNEEIPLPFFKYVFSTGRYIDSLQVSGEIRDALQKKPNNFISVMLYAIDSAYTDSAVYKKTPTYISYTKDSLNTFQIENIKEGTYKLVALEDKNSNYQFDPAQDKIAFVEAPISVPTDSSFQLTLFQEILDFEASRPKHASKQHLIFGYQGIADSVKINLLSEKPTDYEYHVIKDRKTDTLHYFFKPEMQRDSLLFEVVNQEYRDTLTVYLRKQEKDSLQFEAFPTGTIGFEEKFTLSANIPLVEKDSSLISILDKDSLSVAFQTELQGYENELVFEFEKEEAQNYQITLLPGALTDFFGKTNDTLNYRLRTQEISDYGILTLNLQNVEAFPIIVQLTTPEGEVVKELYSDSDPVFNFENIEPGQYFVRIIFDANENGFWDTGSYLKNRQPERVKYFPDTLEVRANWDVTETFILD